MGTLPGWREQIVKNKIGDAAQKYDEGYDDVGICAAIGDKDRFCHDCVPGRLQETHCVG
jgi:hypothetical protein